MIFSSLLGGRSNYDAAKPLLSHYLKLSQERKPSLIIGSDQTLAALVRELQVNGLNCPDDISLISENDSTLCKLTYPSLTVIEYDYQALAENAVTMLINHLDKGVPLTHEISNHNFPGRIIQRESCIAVIKD